MWPTTREGIVWAALFLALSAFLVSTAYVTKLTLCAERNGGVSQKPYDQPTTYTRRVKRQFGLDLSYASYWQPAYSSFSELKKAMNHGGDPGEGFPAKKSKLVDKYNIQSSVGKKILREFAKLLLSSHELLKSLEINNFSVLAGSWRASIKIDELRNEGKARIRT